MNFETTRLVRQLRSIDRPSDNDTRVQILTAAQALCQRLETPFEWVQRMTWQEVSKQPYFILASVPSESKNKICSNTVYVHFLGFVLYPSYGVQSKTPMPTRTLSGYLSLRS